MENERDQVKAWIKQNRLTLNKYSPDEIAYMAVKFAGFNVEPVCYVLSHFQDALQGSSADNRAQFHVDCEAHAMEARAGKIHLTEQWFALYRKIELGKDWDE